MYKLLLKKSFFDGWDNILFLFLSNIIFTACVLTVGFTGQFWLVPIAAFVFSLHLLGVNGSAFNMTRSEKDWKSGYFRALKKVGHLIVYYLCLLLSLGILFYIAPLYMALGDLAWYTVGVFMAACGLVIFLALTYYFPLCLAMENDKPIKTLKKCFIVFFDNFWFSIYLCLKNICDLVISVFTMLLMPGFTGLCISTNSAVMFFMLRYDWMEEKKVGKHNVSADMYLAPVFEQYSERNLRTLFYPWKNN